MVKGRRPAVWSFVGIYVQSLAAERIALGTYMQSLIILTCGRQMRPADDVLCLSQTHFYFPLPHPLLRAITSQLVDGTGLNWGCRLQ